MRWTRDQVLKVIENNRTAIKRLGVKRLGLFGSYARKTQDDVSDLDFIVEFEKKSFDVYMELKILLEELFDTHVDLVLVNTIKPRLRTVILEETVYASGF